jgi:predicted Rossmann-fold nucleotide-binding protein
MPGGFGTLDEMTEMVTLVQTGKIPSDVPIILYGEKFWTPFMDWVQDVLLEENRFLNKEEMAIIHLVDTPEDAMKIVRRTHERPYGSETLKTMRRGQKNIPWCKP